MSNPRSGPVGTRRPAGRRDPPPTPPTIGPVLDLVLLRHGQSTWNAENLFTGGSTSS